MKTITTRHPVPRRGFTLVELLVVITIVVVLAAVTFSVASKAMARAASATAFSNLRQCGMILLSDAQEKSGKLTFFAGGQNAFDLRAYNIVRSHMGKTSGQWNNNRENLIEIMHWNVKKVPPNNFHWNCYAVNFSDNEEFGSFWRIDNGRPDGSNARTLSIPSVRRPEAVPFLMDSSTANGGEIFRVGIVGNELPGMRNNGKCHAIFLDGTGRAMSRSDLKRAGFASAYDNSTKPPKLTRL